jgi:amino acid adenylation domain-containing protein
MLAMFSNSNGSMYFNRMALAQSASLDRRLLKEAWLKVMAKHEMLRTGFVQLQDQKHPFAMVTYREGAAELPWFEAASASSDASLPKNGENILKNLHLPPWYLVSEGSGSTATLQFSALHAIYDAQSLHLILADVVAAYRGESLGNAVSINPTLGPILTESFLKSDDAESFWKELSKDVQPTKFPDLHPYRSEKRELLDASILCSKPRKVLEDGCQKIGVTLQAAGQAAWARLLSAYTGEPNVVFGSVSSGRNLSTTAQEAAFPCLVTVPSPCKVDGTNRQLLDSILKRNASLVKHQFAPLSKIQRWLKADEGLFDTLFVYQKFSAQRGDADAWKIVDEDTRIDYPVSIEMVPHSTELELRLTHRGDVVPAEQATVILDQLHRLLEDSIFSPDSSSNDYSALGAPLLAVTPAKEDRIPCSASLLHQFVENNAAAVPSKTAFEFAWEITEESIQKRKWTYKELHEDGNKIARLLQSKGATPGGLIGICFDKCPEASLGILGVMKAGCAYVAIDPNAPNARKQFILEDSGANLLLCIQSGKADLGDLTGVELIALDEPGLLDGFPSTDPILSRPVSPGDTCYCLYTSGTTGTPKGCEITHENAVQAMLAFQRLFDGHWNSESRWLQFASFHFDVSVLEQYWSWSVGICVTSCPRDLLFEDLPGTIQRLRITHIDLTPSLARLVHPDEVPSLCEGVFITGGEQLKQEILDSWGKHGVIYNGYGPTEVTIGCTMLPRVPANGKPSNIGPQFDNVGSYVLVPGTLTPVLRGGVGELCVSGALVGRGYLNREELTKERFQFLSEHGERIYRTGDLVRILHDGSFHFLGRIDDQVKLRGQRLEIGEINEVIRGATPELGEAATLVVKHPKQSREQLVSFVTRNTAERKPPSAEVRFAQDDQDFLSDIKSVCHTKLPGYMVPTHIIPMTLLPLSANNKVDMKVLKAIYQELSLEEIQKLAPLSSEKRKGSSEEQRIISVLSGFTEPTEGEILPWTSIYELGLDSISVISFSRRLKDAGFVQSQPSLIMKSKLFP